MKLNRSLNLITDKLGRQAAGSLFIGIGLAVFLAVWFSGQQGAANQLPVAQALKSSQAINSSQPLIAGQPIRVSIPSLNINLNVAKGYYYPKTNSWTLSPVNAQWAVMTPEANNRQGATFIYGHALMNVFGRLPKIKPGAKAVINTDNGHVFTYAFTSSSVISPTDTSLFKYQGKPILILQTCSGAWYQSRQLFILDLKEVS